MCWDVNLSNHFPIRIFSPWEPPAPAWLFPKSTTRCPRQLRGYCWIMVSCFEMTRWEDGVQNGAMDRGTPRRPNALPRCGHPHSLSCCLLSCCFPSEAWTVNPQKVTVKKRLCPAVASRCKQTVISVQDKRSSSWILWGLFELPHGAVPETIGDSFGRAPALMSGAKGTPFSSVLSSPPGICVLAYLCSQGPPSLVLRVKIFCWFLPLFFFAQQFHFLCVYMYLCVHVSGKSVNDRPTCMTYIVRWLRISLKEVKKNLRPLQHKNVIHRRWINSN